MARVQSTRYHCEACGHESIKWMGRCPECAAWNTFREHLPEAGRSNRATGRLGTQDDPAGGRLSPGRTGALITAGELSERIAWLGDLESGMPERLSSGIDELDRVLGGGFVPGTAVVVGGEPGIGKSTLMLQAAAAANLSTLYLSGEESPRQVALRAERLGLRETRIQVAAETELGRIDLLLSEHRPELLIVDSVQTLFAAELGGIAGGVTQVRACAQELTDWARRSSAVLLMVAHVTKEGSIAGPKLLEHVVDAVLYFEHAENELRFLRAAKNRFGAIEEIGLFEMHEHGLQQVLDPASIFLVRRDNPVPSGIAAAPVFEGTRILLVELQALTVPAKGGVSRVFSDRIDSGRVSRVAAVLERHLGIRFSDQDIYVNVAGGIRIGEVAVELPLAVALYSARTGHPVPAHTIVTGEISLAGEVRPVRRVERRARTAAELGYRQFLAPPAAPGESRSVPLQEVTTLSSCIEAVFGRTVR